MALTEAIDVPREEGMDIALYDAEAGSEIHSGAALGWTGSPRKFVRPFVDGDVLAGLALESRDSSLLGAGDELTVDTLVSGAVELDVAGVDDDSKVGSTVYLTDDGTYSLTDTGSDTVFGAVKKVVVSGRAVVKFAAV